MNGASFGEIFSADPWGVGSSMVIALGLGLGTLFFRVGFAELRDRLTLSERTESALCWLPVAALAAMVVPAFLPKEGNPADPALLGAAALSAAVGYRSRNTLLGVGAGLLVYWLLGR